MKEKIILVGGGGHCRSVIDVIEEQGIYQIAGIVDVPQKIGSSILGYKVFATDSDLPKLANDYKHFCITIGHIKSNRVRKDLYFDLKNRGANFPVITSPIAYVSRFARIKEGSVVMHRSVVNANASVGIGCIANTGCIIEHDVLIDDHCHIGPSAAVNGGCNIGTDCFIGSNAVVAPGITILNNSLIAAGSVVISNIEENSMYAGNPAKLKKKVS